MSTDFAALSWPASTTETRIFSRLASQERVVSDFTSDERPCQRPAPCLVRACDEPHAELAIESEEALAAGSSHAAESTS